MKILGIGNAIVDVLCKVDDNFLKNNSLTKSTMKLVDENEFKNSWIYDELHQARNVKPSFQWGLIPAMLFTGIDQKIFGGKLPFTLQHKHADHDGLVSAKDSKKINYPKYDGEFTFDKPSSVYLSGTNHAEDQPCHLLLKDKNLTTNYTLEEYDEPAQRYCPAKLKFYL